MTKDIKPNGHLNHLITNVNDILCTHQVLLLTFSS